MGFLSGALAAQDRISSPDADETIVIKANEAWEDETADVIHFRGDFQLESPDWTVTADQATLYGKLDDPETVILSGSPVYITIYSNENAGDIDVSGYANRIVYQKDPQSLRMEGKASLSRDDNTLSGSDIEYDISNDRVTASGAGGVRVQLDTTESSEP